MAPERLLLDAPGAADYEVPIMHLTPSPVVPRPLPWIVGFLLLAAASLSAAELGFDPAVIESATGVKGARNDAEGVFKVSLPRTDVPVTVEGWRIPPFMGLTSWAAFKGDAMGMTMVMGDTVLFEDEVDVIPEIRAA